MAKYKKKPVVIEAFQFYVEPMPDWFLDKVTKNEIVLVKCNYDKYTMEQAYCEIETLEGMMLGNGGDYIIQGIKGEVYPCKADIFKETYELISE